jgi:hypothetical protein
LLLLLLRGFPVLHVGMVLPLLKLMLWLLLLCNLRLLIRFLLVL